MTPDDVEQLGVIITPSMREIIDRITRATGDRCHVEGLVLDLLVEAQREEQARPTMADLLDALPYYDEKRDADMRRWTVEAERRQEMRAREARRLELRRRLSFHREGRDRRRRGRSCQLSNSWRVAA